MAIYLKKFENHTQYENYINGSDAILPNVSICTTEDDVHYNPSTPPTPSHDYVEIGGIKWATMNVGANSITDGGLYFQWGDTQGYTAAQVGVDKNFEGSDYQYYDDGSYTKYNAADELITLQPSDDAVTAAWGGNWRTPTMSELQALVEAVNTGWTTDYQGSGVSGLVMTDKTDTSKVLFFPAVGYADYGSVHDIGSYGNYWSSSVSNDSEDYQTYTMYFDVNSGWGDTIDSRYYGLSVRGVLDE